MIDRLAVAKFLKSRVWNNDLQLSTLISGVPNFHKHSVGKIKGRRCATNQLDPSSIYIEHRLVTNTDRQLILTLLTANSFIITIFVFKIF